MDSFIGSSKQTAAFCIKQLPLSGHLILFGATSSFKVKKEAPTQPCNSRHTKVNGNEISVIK